MYTKGIAVLAITRRGVETALKIKEALDKDGVNSTIYTPKKFSQNGVVTMEKKVGDLIKDIYSTVDALVAVMATGITIRAVAPLLESKLTDPAVVGVDATGKFVISLLSGHYGGANELSRTIAKGIGATPVITTASDVTGKMSVDEIAKTLHLTIENPESLVPVNSAIVNGDPVIVVLIGNIKIPMESINFFELKKAENEAKALEIISQFDAGIIITHEPLSIAKFVKPFIILKTKKIVVGLGARKHSPADNIVQAVNASLQRLNIPGSRVNCFATVDIKKTSKPMAEAVERLGASLEFLSVDALRSVSYSDLSPDSAMVQEKIGVGGVSERAALLVAGKNSKLLMKKVKLKGVTVAIAEGE